MLYVVVACVISVRVCETDSFQCAVSVCVFYLCVMYDINRWSTFLCCISCSLETSPITDSDLSKRTVFQRSYSVVASEYDKQHSASPARVKAVPRRRVHSGDAGG